MAVHAIVMSKLSSLFCKKWLSDSVNFYSECSVFKYLLVESSKVCASNYRRYDIVIKFNRQQIFCKS
jgi:hypothetical protein